MFIFPRTLSCLKLNDGLYHFIGAIFEQEFHLLNCKGFTNYTIAIDTRIKYGYGEFKNK